MTHDKLRALRALIFAALIAIAPAAQAGEWERPALAGFEFRFGDGGESQFAPLGAAKMLAAAETDEWQQGAIFLAVIGVGVVTWVIIEAYDDDNY